MMDYNSRIGKSMNGTWSNSGKGIIDTYLRNLKSQPRDLDLVSINSIIQEIPMQLEDGRDRRYLFSIKRDWSFKRNNDSEIC